MVDLNPFSKFTGRAPRPKYRNSMSAEMWRRMVEAPNATMRLADVTAGLDVVDPRRTMDYLAEKHGVTFEKTKSKDSSGRVVQYVRVVYLKR